VIFGRITIRWDGFEPSDLIGRDQSIWSCGVVDPQSKGFYLKSFRFSKIESKYVKFKIQIF
jgi:hypothetical protein